MNRCATRFSFWLELQTRAKYAIIRDILVFQEIPGIVRKEDIESATTYARPPARLLAIWHVMLPYD